MHYRTAIWRISLLLNRREEEAPEFSSDFASAAWEVYLAKSVVNTLMAHTDRAVVRALMAQLAKLAAGPHDSGSTKLHASAVDGMIIVWDIAIQFSLREQIYTHGVRVHSLTDKKGLKQSAASVKDSISHGRQSTLRKMTAAGEYSPCCEITGSVGRNIALAYLPWAYCQQGRKLAVEYFGETYPVEVAAVGYQPLYDPENLKPRS